MAFRRSKDRVVGRAAAHGQLAGGRSLRRRIRLLRLRPRHIVPRPAMRNTKHGSGLGAMALGCGTRLRLVESVSPSPRAA